jgi:hypothetical protein
MIVGHLVFYAVLVRVVSMEGKQLILPETFLFRIIFRLSGTVLYSAFWMLFVLGEALFWI